MAHYIFLYIDVQTKLAGKIIRSCPLSSLKLNKL